MLPELVIIQRPPTEQITCELCREPFDSTDDIIDLPTLTPLKVHKVCALHEVERHLMYASMCLDYGVGT